LQTSVVHTHNPQPLIYGAPAARLAGAGVVHTKHGLNPDVFRRRWLRRRAASFVHTFVAVSDETGYDAVRNGEVDRCKLRVIRNGIDPVRFRPNPDTNLAVRASLAIAPDDAVIGTVGRLCSVKNQSLLLRAVAPLLRTGAWLVVVGDGPDRQSLEALAAQLGVGARIHWLGELHDVAAPLSAMNAFALSSDSEGLPLVILEAMATELPVVATAVGGVPGVVLDGRTGFLVPAGDEAGLGERLGQVLADRVLAGKLGRSGRARVLARFCSDRVAREYEHRYVHAWRASRSPWQRRIAALNATSAAFLWD
jgi:glycosyltransferase involved in cell wall biosynthesis